MPIPLFGWMSGSPVLLTCSALAFVCACVVSVVGHLIDSAVPEPPPGWRMARRRVVRIALEALVLIGMVVGLVGLVVAL